jgi:proton-dependent oligopeptide transporter, POT family
LADQESSLAADSLPDKEFWGHPAGLVNLFFTEMWERFSYYGMKAILMLYMLEAISSGGMGMSQQDAAQIFGLYTMSVYLASVPGGLIADRFIGQRYAVLLGGIIIALGHFAMALPMTQTFFAGMILIVAGTGLLKPNISSMLGMLYKEGDPRRDGGFSIFYIGINIGAALAPLACGYLAQHDQFKAWLTSMGWPAHSSWHWGFGAAGVGMVIGLIFYLLQWKMLGTAGLKPQKKEGEVKVEAAPLNKEESRRIGAIVILAFFNLLFWAIYEQGGTSLNVFADRLTDCTFMGYAYPSSWLQFWQAGFIIVLAPLFSMLWLRLGDKQPTAPAKFTFGLLLLGLGIVLMVPASMLAAQGKVSAMWLVSVYFLEVCGELCLSPVGLSTVTKLAPLRFVGLTMGAWFISNALGNYAAGALSGFFDENDTSKLTYLFGSMAVATFIGTAILAMLIPQVKKLMGSVK